MCIEEYKRTALREFNQSNPLKLFIKEKSHNDVSILSDLFQTFHCLFLDSTKRSKGKV